jgi:hypothetical protein
LGQAVGHAMVGVLLWPHSGPGLTLPRSQVLTWFLSSDLFLTQPMSIDSTMEISSPSSSQAFVWLPTMFCLFLLSHPLVHCASSNSTYSASPVFCISHHVLYWNHWFHTYSYISLTTHSF